jgi:hypothetical protein
MLDLERPRHAMSSAAEVERFPRPDVDPVTSEEEDIDDNRTLAGVMKGKKVGTFEEGVNSPGGSPLPNHPTKPRAATLKCKASTYSGREETPT